MMKIICLITIATLLTVNVAQAKEKFPGEKSMPLGVALGLDPLSGDGLIYSGHPVQGSIAMGIQVAGFVGGLIYALSKPKTNTLADLDRATAFAIPFLATTIPTYLWDAIGTPIYINKHNKKIREEGLKVTPTLSYGESNTVTAGFQIKF